MEAAFHGGEGEAEAGGGFFTAEAFDIAEDVDFFVFGGDFFEGVLDAAFELGVNGFVFGGGCVGEGEAAFHEVIEADDGAGIVAFLQSAAGAASDLDEPGLEVFFVAEGVDGAIGGEEGLDEDIFGVVVVAAHAE